LKEIQRKLGHDHITVLKTDIEGYEWQLLDREQLERYGILQLLMEWHIKYYRRATGYGGTFDGGMMLHYFHTLELQKFRLAQMELVCPKCPSQRELLWLNHRKYLDLLRRANKFTIQ
jgi:hypothetical protein